MFSIIQKLITPDFFGKMVRTAAQTATAGLVTHGVINGSDQETLVGAIALIASVIWTAVAHIQSAPATPANASTGGLQ